MAHSATAITRTTLFDHQEDLPSQTESSGTFTYGHGGIGSGGESTDTTISNPIEICTIARAEQLGIYNGYHKSYNNDANGNKFDDLKTYDQVKDTAENRTKNFCTYNVDDTSTRNCIDQYGIGFTKITDSTNGSICQMNDCPPNFSATPDGKCIKPLIDAEIDKRSKCDERWYDWFIVPNYHLGNGVYSSNIGTGGTCYSACKEYQVPAYYTDPVDDTILDYVTIEDLTKCVSRKDYFYGKYSFGSDYCPLAWIHRINSTTNANKIILNRLYDNYNTSNMVTSAFNTYANNPTKIESDAYDIMVKASSEPYDMLDLPLSKEMKNACDNLSNKDRLTDAYNWCLELKNNETEYRDRIIRESGTATDIDSKIGIMKQACNNIFCNEDSIAFQYIKGKSICFEDAPDIIKANSAPAPTENVTIQNKNNLLKFIKSVVNIFYWIFIIPVIILTCYVLYSRLLYPFLFKPVWLLIRRMLGEAKSVQEIMQSIIDRIRKQKKAEYNASISK